MSSMMLLLVNPQAQPGFRIWNEFYYDYYDDDDDDDEIIALDSDSKLAPNSVVVDSDFHTHTHTRESRNYTIFLSNKTSICINDMDDKTKRRIANIAWLKIATHQLSFHEIIRAWLV